MSVITAALPIIHPNLAGKLTQTARPSLTRNELGVWTLVRHFTCPGPSLFTLLPAPLSADAALPTLFLCPDGINIVPSKVMAEITLTYKGFIGSVGAPVGDNEVVLQSAQLQDTAGNSVSCFYYTNQTTWRWATRTYPTSPVSTEILGSAAVVTPFNTMPTTAASDLQYTIAKQVTNFGARKVANHWECSACICNVLVPQEINLIDGYSSGGDDGDGLDTGDGLTTGGL